MARVVVWLVVAAFAVGVGPAALASRSHGWKAPKVRIHKPHAPGHRGRSSYGGAAWTGSSYDHHKHKHPPA